eukprot:182911-Prymnesium_polylepis.1
MDQSSPGTGSISGWINPPSGWLNPGMRTSKARHGATPLEVEHGRVAVQRGRLRPANPTRHRSNALGPAD